MGARTPKRNNSNKRNTGNQQTASLFAPLPSFLYPRALLSSTQRRVLPNHGPSSDGQRLGPCRSPGPTSPPRHPRARRPRSTESPQRLNGNGGAVYLSVCFPHKKHAFYKDTVAKKKRKELTGIYNYIYIYIGSRPVKRSSCRCEHICNLHAHVVIMPSWGDNVRSHGVARTHARLPLAVSSVLAHSYTRRRTWCGRLRRLKINWGESGYRLTVVRKARRSFEARALAVRRGKQSAAMTFVACVGGI